MSARSLARNRVQLLFSAVALWSMLVSAQPLRDERTIFLSDADCTEAEVLFATLNGVRLYASCTSDGAHRVLRLSVANLAREESGPLRSFDVGFCEPSVVSVSAQPGWKSLVRDRTVEWSVADDAAEDAGIPPRARVGGFVVRLKPGWRKSQYVGAAWRDSVVATTMTHDCWK